VTLRAGQSARHEFTIDDAAMRAFQALSGDLSAVHCDAAFARARGFDDVIVYGGLMLAQLSQVLGMQLPGTSGTSVRWTIEYRGPLYVGEAAVLTLEIVDVSPGTGLVHSRFTIASAARKVATGTVQSLLPPQGVA
jgi:3-hydroxybutyryl-CoA dehydratase